MPFRTLQTPQSVTSESFSENDPSLVSRSTNKPEMKVLMEVEMTSSRVGKRILQSPSERDTSPKKPCVSAFSSDLDKFFVPFIPFIPCADESEIDEDELEFSEDDKSDVPSITEREKQGIEFDCHINNIVDEVNNLKSYYKGWAKDFKEYSGLQGTLLEAFEYLSVNKDNVLNTILHFAPEQYDTASVWLSGFDNSYKWADCAVPLIAHIAKYHLICGIQEQLKEHQKECNKFLSSPTGRNAFSSSSNTKQIKEMQKIFYQFNFKLEKEKKAAWNKVNMKSARFTTKVFSLFVNAVGKLQTKTANKVGKGAFDIFRNIWGICTSINTYSLQKQWLFHVRSHFVVNIDPAKPTLDQAKRIEERETAQEKLINDVKEFLSLLSNCTTIEEVRAKFKRVGLSCEIPSTIEGFKQQFKNPRFIRQLVQNYYYCAGQTGVAMNSAQIASFLRQKGEEQNSKIDLCLPFIAEQIDLCQEMSFAQIERHFAKKLHINISFISIENNEELPLPPQTEEEWEQCIQNEEFSRALAGQWVDFQETSAQLAMQALRQALLSKHRVERKFLFFQAAQHAFGIVSTLVQLALCSPIVKLFELSSILELLITDMTKLGIPCLGLVYIGYPLYPEVKFKLESIFLLLVKHFFSIKHKPNEYSLESYRLIMQIRMLELVLAAHFLQFLLKQAVLWLSMRLVENCMLRLKKHPLAEDQRYINMYNQYEQYHLNCRQNIQDLKACLNELQLKDAKLTINPRMQHAGPNQKKNDPIEKLEKLNDPIAALVNGLEEANIDYFPPAVIEFFENNVGFKLTNANKCKLQGHLEEFFAKGEDFIESYSENRFAYLRG